MVLGLINGAFLGVAHAQEGSFIIPTLRGQEHSDFAFWDLFLRLPGNPPNYNVDNAPALLDGTGADDEGNLTTAFGDRTNLRQTGTDTAFVISSSAIYSFAEPTAFEIPYKPPTTSVGEVTNVLIQTQTGGVRMDVNNIRLVYTETTANGPVVHELPPSYRGLDDPQVGSFSERIVTAFQWNVTGLNIRDFKITFFSPNSSMPLWKTQLDVVVGAPFVRELGYLLTLRSRPSLRDGRAGVINTNLASGAESRFFLSGQSLDLSTTVTTGWLRSGWYFDGAPVTTATLPITFTDRDLSVSGLFAPRTYAAWRTAMFNHFNPTLGLANDYNNDAVSAKAVDHDDDGLDNSGEYAFSGDPYQDDAVRWRPQMLLVDVGGVNYPALRYRTNGAPASNGDTSFVVQLSTDGTTWADNGTTPTTLEISRALQPDGSELVTERALQPAAAFASLTMRVKWSVTGVEGTPLLPAPLTITSPEVLAAGRVGTAYGVGLAATGGTAPYTWSLDSGELSPGLTLSSAGVLSGIPLAEGVSSFTVELTDANHISVTKEMTVTINPFVINTISSLADAQVGVVYPATTLTATGGTAPFVWSLSAGELPLGLTLSASGVLAGTPTAAGLNAFTVQIKDANNFIATKAFSLTFVEISITTAPSLPGGVKDVPYLLNLAGTGGVSPYTWTTTDTLPAGLELSETGVISGTPTAAVQTTSTFTVKLKDSSTSPFSVTKDFSLIVYPTYQRPVVNPVALGVTTIGAFYEHTVGAVNYPKTFAITGLPKGLTYVAATGAISGRPSVSGIFNIQIKATNTAGSSVVVTAPLVVKALDRGFIGTFTGIVSRDSAMNGNLGSRLAVTTTINGSYTVKITTGATAVSATGFLAASAPQISATVGGKALKLNIVNDLIDGTYRGAVVTSAEQPLGATVSGWRSTWNVASNPASNHVGYYSIGIDLADVGEGGDDGVESIPQGSGYATFSVVEAGTLTVLGKTADGQAITSAGFMGPNGEIAIYTGLYTNKGSIVGELKLTKDEEGLFTENIVRGALTWSKPRTTAKAYEIGFDSINLKAYGKYLAQSSKSIVLGLPETGTANFVFTDGGLAASATEPNFSFTYSDENKVTVLANAAQASLTINRATGAVAGKFTLTELTPPLVRKNIAFQGQIVRQASGVKKAVGYFLLQQKPVSGPISASPILSGGISIEQP